MSIPTSTTATIYDDLISVIVPVYNIEQYLPLCLSCLSAQSYKNLEIILVDDASEDGSGSILDSFAKEDARATVIHHDRNRGLSAARNTGLDLSHGAYVWFLDGDDFFHRDFLRLLHNAILLDGGYDVAFAGWKATAETNEDWTSALNPEYRVYTQESYFSFIFEKNPDIWNKLFKRSVLEGIHFRPYPRAQARDFNLRVAYLIHRAISVKNCMYFWRQRPTSLSKTADAKELYLSCWSYMYYDIYTNCPDGGKFSHRLLLNHLFYTMIQWKLLVTGNSKQDQVFSVCRQFARDTRWAFLRCRQICFTERLVCLLLFYHPHLVSRLVSYKKQHPKFGVKSLKYTLANFLLRFAYL